jgi:hypothetical protein
MTQKITDPGGPGVSSGPAATLTRVLLACGAIAGPLFVVVAGLQMLTRDGFDPSRHAISLLSNGELGWVQIANFVAAGLLFLGGAVGMRRVLQPDPGGTWGPRLIGALGVALVWGGVFVANRPTASPRDPPGAPRPAQLAQHPAHPGPASGVPGHAGGVLGVCPPLPPHRAAGVGGLLHRDRRGGRGPRRCRGCCGRFSVAVAGVVLLWGWASVMAAQLLTGRPDAPGQLRAVGRIGGPLLCTVTSGDGPPIVFDRFG